MQRLETTDGLEHLFAAAAASARSAGAKTRATAANARPTTAARHDDRRLHPALVVEATAVRCLRRLGRRDPAREPREAITIIRLQPRCPRR
jgi:hypothetical protein